MSSALPPLIWPQLIPPLLGALLGLVAGSFLATLAIRWPQGLSLGGRSRCDGCGLAIRGLDLVPLVGWWRLKGRCRACGSAIDPVQPAMEGACALVGALALAAVPGFGGLAGALFGWLLVALLVLDMRHHWLPDRLVLPLLALGLLMGAAPPAERLLAAAVGGGGLLALHLGYRALRGREGLGLGDVKLMAAIGPWLSPAHLAPLLLLAAVIGLAFALASTARGRPLGRTGRVPFGACLAAAAFPLWLAAAWH